ncbi:hypothetical protein NL676_008681 [Syzygium grande]|nr:hypothetical protein NL676_008681 [Syzygium grande]
MSVARGDLRREREVVRRRWRQREREGEEKRRGCGGSRRGATELHSLWPWLWLCFSGGEVGDRAPESGGGCGKWDSEWTSPGPDQTLLASSKEPGIVGVDVTRVMLHFSLLLGFLGLLMQKNISDKSSHPSRMSEFRPILCDEVYNCITKILSLRLRRISPSFVHPNRSAFIEGRNIADKIPLTHEIVKRYHISGVSVRCFVKADIVKAFDSVNRDFIFIVLKAFGTLQPCSLVEVFGRRLVHVAALPSQAEVSLVIRNTDRAWPKSRSEDLAIVQSAVCGVLFPNNATDRAVAISAGDGAFFVNSAWNELSVQRGAVAYYGWNGFMECPFARVIWQKILHLCHIQRTIDTWNVELE